MTDAIGIALAIAAGAFAVSLGAHYTGACMGMAHAARVVRRTPALLLMAPLTFAGAALASGAVETTVGGHLLGSGSTSVALALAIVVVAFLLTSLFNVLKLPTSTIQILVFSVAGGGLAAGLPVEWTTIGRLVVVWALVPPLAAGIAWLLTRLTAASPSTALPSPAGPSVVGAFLLAAGAGASFVMGANDVSNASGPLLIGGLFTPLGAALLGGAGLAVGILTWGRPLLQRVAFETVALDRRMATISQAVQASLVFGAVAFGYFTSLNQALVGAMAGTGLARDRRTINTRVVRGILVGWAVGPLSGLALTFGLTATLRALGVVP